MRARTPSKNPLLERPSPWECLPGSDSLGEPPWESLPGKLSLESSPWKALPGKDLLGPGHPVTQDYSGLFFFPA